MAKIVNIATDSVVGIQCGNTDTDTDTVVNIATDSVVGIQSGSTGGFQSVGGDDWWRGDDTDD